MNRKYNCNFVVNQNLWLSEAYSLLKIRPDEGFIDEFGIKPGQFVQIATPANATYLRRPISVCNIDADSNELWLLIRRAGKGTDALCNVEAGLILNLVLPLGNGFTVSESCGRTLLAGGGVGVAPLLYLGRQLDAAGCNPTFLLGARSQKDVLLFDQFAKYGDVFISTEDGSAGEKGLITENTILRENFDRFYCCGPMPMMKAVAAIARCKEICCEVSLENVMACGIGACLCCVEKTTDKGNVCVCTEGPVFNIDRLQW